jgi:hypothetical protein
MRISASIQDVVEQGRDLYKIPRMYRDGDRKAEHSWLGWAHTGNAMSCSRNME